LPESDPREATGSVTMLYQQLSAGDAAAVRKETLLVVLGRKVGSGKKWW
jgi:hypothetical protein